MIHLYPGALGLGLVSFYCSCSSPLSHLHSLLHFSSSPLLSRFQDTPFPFSFIFYCVSFLIPPSFSPPFSLSFSVSFRRHSTNSFAEYPFIPFHNQKSLPVGELIRRSKRLLPSFLTLFFLLGGFASLFTRRKLGDFVGYRQSERAEIKSGTKRVEGQLVGRMVLFSFSSGNIHVCTITSTLFGDSFFRSLSPLSLFESFLLLNVFLFVFVSLFFWWRG